MTVESSIRLPSYQNAYGQGLHGQFAFFNGQGGGLNDGVAENWGPALQGQPIAQASLRKRSAREVRPWVANPDNVSGFFVSARTLTTNAAAQASNDRGSFRLSVNNRDFTGVTPRSSITRRGAGLPHRCSRRAHSTRAETCSIRATRDNTVRARVSIRATPCRRSRSSGGRSTSRRCGITSSMRAGNPISWNYNGQNNPYFDSELNLNSDDQSRVFGGLGASYALSPSLSAVARAGADSYDATPRVFGRAALDGRVSVLHRAGEFPEGGVDNERISVSEKNAEAALHFTPGGPTSRLALSVGASWRGTSLTTTDTVVADTATGVAGAPKVITPNRFASDDNMHAIFGSAQLRFQDYGSVTAAARNEWSSVYAPGHDSQLYPSVVGVLDLKRAMSSLRDDAVDRRRAASGRHCAIGQRLERLYAAGALHRHPGAGQHHAWNAGQGRREQRRSRRRRRRPLSSEETFSFSRIASTSI